MRFENILFNKYIFLVFYVFKYTGCGIIISFIFVFCERFIRLNKGCRCMDNQMDLIFLRFTDFIILKTLSLSPSIAFHKHFLHRRECYFYCFYYSRDCSDNEASL